MCLVHQYTRNCVNVACFYQYDIPSMTFSSFLFRSTLCLTKFLFGSYFPFYSQTNPGLPSSHHRRVACSFRDQCLFQIFQISLTSLHQLKNDGTRLNYLSALSCWKFIGFLLHETESNILRCDACSQQPVARIGSLAVT